MTRALRALAVAPALVLLLAAIFAGSAPSIARVVHDAFDPLCHQDPARSAWLFGAPLAVCWRCLGVYAGVALAALAWERRWFGDGRAWPALLGLAALDWALTRAGATADAGVERLATGVVGGVGLALALSRASALARSVAAGIARRSRVLATALLVTLGACGGVREQASTDPHASTTAGADDGAAGTDAAIDARALLRELEERLAGAREVAIDVEIESHGAHEAAYRGTLTLGPARIALDVRGTFGGAPSDLSLQADDETVHLTHGGEPAFERAADPSTRDALITGLVRMGLLHNLAMLHAGEPPDVRAVRASDWVELADAHGERSGDRIVVRARVVVEHASAGEVVLALDAETRLPVERRVTVHFDEGDMDVLERYTVRVTP